MRRSLGFGPELRVRRKPEYDRAFKGGVSVRDANLKLIVARAVAGTPPGTPAPGAATRLGTAVSRKAGDAVTRNRIRRRLREAFRHVRAELPTGLDLVAIPVETAKEPPLAALGQSIVALARKGAKRIEEREAPRAPSPAPTTPPAP